MKRILFILVALANIAYAQTTNIPNYLNLVAVARDTAGQPVTQQIDVKLEIYQGAASTGGALTYCEQVQNIQPNNYGEIAVVYGYPVGANNNLYCANQTGLSSANWTAGNKWYRLSWRITGAANYVSIDSGFFASVPYAFASRTAEQLVNVGAAPAVGSTLTWNGIAWAAGNENPWSNYMIAEDRESSGSGGGSVAGFNKRVLNTVAASAGTAITLNTTNNSITLNDPGTYYIRATAPAIYSNGNVLYIMDYTTNAYYIYGTGQWATAAYAGYSVSEAEGTITVTTPITFILNHYISTAYPPNGLGITTGSSDFVFAKVLVQKIQ